MNILFKEIKVYETTLNHLGDYKPPVHTPGWRADILTLDGGSHHGIGSTSTEALENALRHWLTRGDRELRHRGRPLAVQRDPSGVVALSDGNRGFFVMQNAYPGPHPTVERIDGRELVTAE